MSEIGERAQSIIGKVRAGVGPDLLGDVDELAGLVKQLDEDAGSTSTTGSGFTQARSVESDPEGRHTPGRPG